MATGNWTADDVKRHNAKLLAKQPRSKYGNKKTTVDGQTFDSAREARRWVELKALEHAGQIARLKRQQAFELITITTNIRGDVQEPIDRVHVVGHYVADFTYDELTPAATRFVVEDSKGMRTQTYTWKKRHFEAQYGIQIRET